MKMCKKITIVLMLLSLVAISLFADESNSERYQRALSLFSNGEYQASYDEFKALGTYSDSKAYARASYNKLLDPGINAYFDEDYTSAILTFVRYNDSELSRIYARKINKRLSDAREKGKQDVVDAITLALETGEKEKVYIRATDLMIAESFEEAISTYETIIDYRDSKGKIEEIKSIMETRERAEAEKEALEAELKAERRAYGYRTNLFFSAGVDTNVAFGDFKISGAFPRFAVSIENQNLIHTGKWGMGLRLDISTIVEPKNQSWSSFKFSELWNDISIDEKIMMYMGTNKFDYYFGAGAGYSIFVPALDSSVQEEYGHSLYNMLGMSTAWFVSANTGMRFRPTEHFMWGAEFNERWLMPANKYSASLDFYIGYTF